MDWTQLREKAELSVSRLVLQYKEYLWLTGKIKELETQKLFELGRLSKRQKKSLAEIKKDETEYPELRRINEQTRQLQTELDQTSDEMTFANPLVWIMYKDKAYKGASNEIPDWKSFKEHCAPEDYICGIRFRFLESFLKKRSGLDLKTAFPDTAHINEVYESDLIMDLSHDLDFMTEWQRNEYLRTSGFINKWQTKKKVERGV